MINPIVDPPVKVVYPLLTKEGTEDVKIYGTLMQLAHAPDCGLIPNALTACIVLFQQYGQPVIDLLQRLQLHPNTLLEYWDKSDRNHATMWNLIQQLEQKLAA